jgi:hypothetical protein
MCQQRVPHWGVVPLGPRRDCHLDLIKVDGQPSDAVTPVEDLFNGESLTSPLFPDKWPDHDWAI